MDASQIAAGPEVARLLDRLGERSIVFVGLMGAGKTAIGRKVAEALGLSFIDSDHEIESVSRMTIPELFEAYGEVEFRALERRVIERLLKSGPQVLSTGGGAYMSATTREAIAACGLSVWLEADLDTLMDRVARRHNRPLLQTADPRATMRRFMEERHPIYGLADIRVRSRPDPKETIAAEVIAAVDKWLETGRGPAPASSPPASSPPASSQ